LYLAELSSSDLLTAAFFSSDRWESSNGPKKVGKIRDYKELNCKKKYHWDFIGGGQSEIF